MALRYKSADRSGVERGATRSSSKFPVSSDQSERRIVCPYEENFARNRKLLLEDRWDDSAGHTLDILDSSFGRMTPPSSIDAQDSEVDSTSHETSITWSTIDIHVHEKVLGDNVPSSGPPVGIGWQAVEHVQVSIDDYEQQRPPRRIRMEMLTPSRSRQDELMESGLSFRELREACLEAATIRRQRQKSSKDGRLIRRIAKLFPWKAK